MSIQYRTADVPPTFVLRPVEDLGDAVPSADLRRVLERRVADQRLSGLTRALGAHLKATDHPGTAATARRTLRVLRMSRTDALRMALLHPLFQYWIVRYRAAVRSAPAGADGVLAEIHLVSPLEELRGAAGPRPDRLPGTEIDVDFTHPWTGEVLRRNAAHPKVGDYPVRTLLRADADARLGATYAAALRTLASAWPELAEDIRATVRMVVPFRDQALLGFTSVLMCGAVFIQGRPDDVDFAAERIVHESAHSSLLRLQSVVRLHDGDHSERLRSPLRQDGRPTLGVLHALFVTTRLYGFHHRLGTRRREAQSLRRRGLAAAGELRADGRLTSAGAALVDALVGNLESR